jgi:hypothetical protein
MLRKAVFLIIAFLAAGAADAQATLRIESHTDPAGDPTPFTYRMEKLTGDWQYSPYEFVLPDSEGDNFLSFGVPSGTYVASALLPSEWKVGDIQCLGEDPRAFVIDVPNGRVTVTHGEGKEDLCAFTIRRASAPAGPGVSPSPRVKEIPKVTLPRKPALLGVTPGRGFAKVTFRLMRRSVVKAKLIRPSGRVVGRRRVVLKPGTYDLQVSLDPKIKRQFRRRGMKRARLTLRIAFTHKNATHVFKHGVVVRL